MGDRPSGDVRGAVLLRKGEAEIVFTIIGIAGFALLSQRGVETKPAPSGSVTPIPRSPSGVLLTPRTTDSKRVYIGKGAIPFQKSLLGTASVWKPSRKPTTWAMGVSFKWDRG